MIWTLSSQPSSATLAAMASLLASETLVEASWKKSWPLNQLGRRPVGGGVWQWLSNGTIKGTVGVGGYDPVQGALAPRLRLQMHVVACLLLWAWMNMMQTPVIILLASLFNQYPTAHFSPTIIASTSVGVYASLMYFTHHCLRGVSDPGGPRKTLTSGMRSWRYPQWTPGIVHLLNDTFSCQFLSTEESHQATKVAFMGTCARLFGESVGRDIWGFPLESKKKLSKEQEEMVQNLASGGREPGFCPATNPNTNDRVFRAQMIRDYIASGQSPPDTSGKPKTIDDAIYRAVHYFSMIQSSDGHWPSDYGGPLFLTPGLVVAWYILGRPEYIFTAEHITLLKFHIKCYQQADGGWGMHIEAPSTMFGAVLNYVALRLLGVPADDPVCVKAHKFMQQRGGAVSTAPWAKCYLCLLGVMDWEGHISVPPEMWLLPDWFPFHPSRMWIHARILYLPMGYLYGAKVVYKEAETDPTILSLRKELYCEDYDSIPWSKTRLCSDPMDSYAPMGPLVKLSQAVFHYYEKLSFFAPFRNWVRREGIEFSLSYMKAEDLQTNYICSGPVNKVLNMISMYHAANGNLMHPTVMNHMSRCPDYLWVTEDGMKMKSYNGAQSWDTSFAIQAINETGLLDHFPDMTRKCWSFLERSQIFSTETSRASPAFAYECPASRGKYYRHQSQGGWSFSNSAQGYAVSDCSGECLKGVLCLQQTRAVHEGLQLKELAPINEERMKAALDVILSFQNEDGGFATYENIRGFSWYEWLNPSQAFADIMIEYSFVECTMTCLTALQGFKAAFPEHRLDEIRHAVGKARDFIKSIQRDDGSWYGSWGCCFCYAGWFGIEGLIKAGEPKESLAIRKACSFLLQHQRPNGGWGEDFTSCYNKVYAENGMAAYGDDGSAIVSTAWVLLALAAAEHEDLEAIQRGVQFLLKRQLPCGDWPQEGIGGATNRALGITYPTYRNVFPVWALGRCRSVYGDALAY